MCVFLPDSAAPGGPGPSVQGLERVVQELHGSRGLLPLSRGEAKRHMYICIHAVLCHSCNILCSSTQRIRECAGTLLAVEYVLQRYRGARSAPTTRTEEDDEIKVLYFLFSLCRQEIPNHRALTGFYTAIPLGHFINGMEG